MRRVIAQIKRYPWLYDLLRHKIYARLQSARRKRLFTDIYNENYWGNSFSVSGPGSSLEATEDVRLGLPSLLRHLDVKSVLDIPCGDLRWMQHVPLNVERYIGADIVASLIEENRARFADKGVFMEIDLLKDLLPPVDAIFCRDCLVHLSIRDVHRALRNLASASGRYVLLTTFPDQQTNIDTVAPYWRALNLERPPFNFPSPIRLLKDFSEGQQNDQGKYLGVWTMEALRMAVSLRKSAA